MRVASRLIAFFRAYAAIFERAQILTLDRRASIRTHKGRSKRLMEHRNNPKTGFYFSVRYSGERDKQIVGAGRGQLRKRFLELPSCRNCRRVQPLAARRDGGRADSGEASARLFLPHGVRKKTRTTVRTGFQTGLNAELPRMRLELSGVCAGPIAMGIFPGGPGRRLEDFGVGAE